MTCRSVCCQACAATGARRTARWPWQATRPSCPCLWSVIRLLESSRLPRVLSPRSRWRHYLMLDPAACWLVSEFVLPGRTACVRSPAVHGRVPGPPVRPRPVATPVSVQVLGHLLLSPPPRGVVKWHTTPVGAWHTTPVGAPWAPGGPLPGEPRPAQLPWFQPP